MIPPEKVSLLPGLLFRENGTSNPAFVGMKPAKMAWGATIMALRHLIILIPLLATVLVGFVLGATQATTPTGLAKVTSLLTGSRSITPTLFLSRR